MSASPAESPLTVELVIVVELVMTDSLVVAKLVVRESFSPDVGSPLIMVPLVNSPLVALVREVVPEIGTQVAKILSTNSGK